MTTIRVWWQQVLIGIDQLLNAVLAGWADETLSSRAWRCRDVQRWSIVYRVIDAIFFWQDGHCRAAYERERAGGQKPATF